MATHSWKCFQRLLIRTNYDICEQKIIIQNPLLHNPFPDRFLAQLRELCAKFVVCLFAMGSVSHLFICQKQPPLFFISLRPFRQNHQSIDISSDIMRNKYERTLQVCRFNLMSMTKPSDEGDLRRLITKCNQVMEGWLVFPIVIARYDTYDAPLSLRHFWYLSSFRFSAFN